ncbi:hypothetical protein [uncultured Jannaschia sp.]|uniref:hypothetical protein n=1 Tax=uncultured Jannaschia sp. TaxID=293347 RepID=UPI002612C91C|nr:hypothetical protein [uncultured Jannaschia sp.]
MTQIRTEDLFREGVSKGFVGFVAGSVMAVASLGGAAGVWSWNRWINDQTETLMQKIDERIDAKIRDANRELRDGIEEGRDRLEGKIDQIIASQSVAIERIDAIERLAQLPREVARLRVPASGPLTDCTERGTCIIRATIERTTAGASCSVIPGETEFYWLDPESGNRFAAIPTNKRPARNIGDTPRTFDWQVEVPDRVVPPGFLDYCLAPVYTDCPGQIPGAKTPYMPPEPICIENIPIGQATRP